MITTCLDQLTPEQSDEVLDCLARSKFKGVNDSLDYTLLEALCECQKNANPTLVQKATNGVCYGR